jgi:hypothetical protein
VNTAIDQRQEFQHGAVERVALDVISRYVDIDVRVTGNGAPITTLCPRVVFRHLDTNANVRATICSSTPATVRLPAGRYSVVGEGDVTRPRFPPFPRILADEADLQTSRTLQLDFNLEQVRVRGHLRHNGAPMTAADGCVSLLFSPVLVESLGDGYLVEVCDGVIDAFMWPDTYDVFVQGRTSPLPPNTRFADIALFAEDGEVFPLELDVIDPRQTVAFRLLFNGSAPAEQALLTFRNLTNASVTIPVTMSPPSFEGSALLAPGALEVFLRSPELPPGVILPRVTVVPVP